MNEHASAAWSPWNAIYRTTHQPSGIRALQGPGHFADDDGDQLNTQRWMGWMIGCQTSKQYGIPRGLPLPGQACGSTAKSAKRWLPDENAATERGGQALRWLDCQLVMEQAVCVMYGYRRAISPLRRPGGASPRKKRPSSPASHSTGTVPSAASRIAVWPVKSSHRRTITSTYFGSSSISRATRLTFGRNQRCARTTERIEHHVTRAARIADRSLDQLHRLHRRMQIVLLRLLDSPTSP